MLNYFRYSPSELKHEASPSEDSTGSDRVNLKFQKVMDHVPAEGLHT
jgi:hypothetical protein